MSEQGKHDSLIDEAARRRFEEAWLERHPQPIEQYLPAQTDSSFLPTLEELVHIELEFAWEAHAAQGAAAGATNATIPQIPVVETYLQRFPELRAPTILARLIEQESRVRSSVGHAASLSDYRNRFPELLRRDGGALESRLKAIAAERMEGFGDTLPADTRAESSGGRTGADNQGTPRRFGGYELLKELGRGGMGIVYQARQLSADRIVALKVIRRDWLESMPAQLRASALDRFRHEAQAAARIEHEHIVRVYEVGAVDGDPFFSMQFVDGQSLAELIAQGPLEGKRAAALLEPVARAVDEAHRRGILHRDLKPQNILVDRQTGTALVADFGLAKLLQTSDDLTCTGDVMGSPPYMSPEQARDSSLVTTQSDVYALGATLYHALTGKPPFHADTVLDTLSKVVHEEPLPLRQADSSIDLDLETICLKCLQKEPPRRYTSSASLADDLACYLSGTPIAARPVGPVERCWLWCRRNPMVATLMASTAGFLLLTLIASVTGYLQTATALGIAEQRHRETRQVINNYFTRVSENRLLNEPGMQPLRRELLEDVLLYYRRFLIEFANDAALRDELALTHFRIGLITEEMDTPQDALSWYETARHMQTKILADQPTDADCLCNLGNTLTAIGRVQQRQLLYDEARHAFEQAIDVRQRLVAVRSGDDESRRMLASSHMNLGLLQKDLHHGQAAKSQYAQAQEIRRHILRDRSHHELTRRDFAMGAFNQGELAAILAGPNPAPSDPQLIEARQYLHHAVTMFEDLLKDNPHSMGNRYRLALCCRKLADLDVDYASAVALYQRALTEMESLALRNPDVPDYQADLAALKMNLGIRNAEHGSLADASEDLGAAQRVLQELVRQYPSVPRYRRDLAVTLQELAIAAGDGGDVAAARKHLRLALKLFEALVEDFPENQEYAKGMAGAGELLDFLSEKEGLDDSSS